MNFPHFRIFLVVLFVCGLISRASAQERKRDSLRQLLSVSKSDTQRIRLNHVIAYSYKRDNTDTSIAIGTRALQLAEKYSASKNADTAVGNLLLGHSYYHLSYFLSEKGDYDRAKIYAEKALYFYERSNNLYGVSDVYTNLSAIYSSQWNFTKGIDYALKSLKISEDQKDTAAMADNYSLIAGIYYNMNDFEHALEYALKSLEIEKKKKNRSGIAMNLGNIANIYSDMGDNKKALGFYKEALRMYEELGMKGGIATNVGNLGDVYFTFGQYDTALVYYKRALAINIERGKIDNIARHLCNMGAVYTKMKKYPEAEAHLLRSLKISDSLGVKGFVARAHQMLSELYAATGQWEKAYVNFQKYTLKKDSLYDAEKRDEITRKDLQYAFQKKEQEDSIRTELQKRERESQHTQEINAQKIYTYTGVGGLLFMIVFAFVLYRSYKQKQKSNLLLEEKNKEILDSINYAKRLQQAILPPDKMINNLFPENFVLYRPKDIVAGDFYFLEARDGKIIIAAADCTGHGVPGAMVSVVCSNALSRAVKEFGITDPGKILDKVRELVLETFEKSERDVKDGMDISLLVFEPSTKKAQWAGANNPLWYLRNNEQVIIGADRQPVGRHENLKPFTTHSLQFQTGDIIHLFTDGIADQFGGPQSKKYKYKRLKELLISNMQQPMPEQAKALEQDVDEWMKYTGNAFEQTDDMLIIGIRIQ